MSPRPWILAAAAVATAVAWYVFRPERAFLTRRVDEAAPGGGVIALTGSFTPRAHQGRGRAEVLRLPDGRHVLRLSDFETLDGPDLQVYLIGSESSENRADLERSGYLSLGALKGNAGAQNYHIPAGTDLGRYGAVAIWCRRFGVNFTTAPLLAPTPGA
jgi:hypothetical protein